MAASVLQPPAESERNVLIRWRASVASRTAAVYWLAPCVCMQWILWAGPQAFLQSDVKRRFGEDASIVYTSAVSVRGMLSFLSSPLLGALSDRFGRKPFILIKTIAGFLYVIPMILPEHFAWRVDMALVLYAASGACGSSFGTPFAYCADVVERDANASVNAALACLLAWSFCPAKILAPQGCSALARSMGDIFMWRALAGIGFGNILYNAIVLPESLIAGKDCRDPDTAAQLNSGMTCQDVNPFRYFRLLRKASRETWAVTSIIRYLCGVLFLLYFAKWSALSVATMFAETNFGWTPGQAGWLTSAWGLSELVTFHIVHRLGSRCNDTAVAWVGLWTSFVSQAIFSCATHGWIMVVAMFIGGTSMTTYTALSSYVGKLVDPTRIGEAQGIAAIMIDLSEIFGPITFGALMRAGKAMSRKFNFFWFVNLPFWLGTASVLAAIVLYYAMLKRSRPRALLSGS